MKLDHATTIYRCPITRSELTVLSPNELASIQCDIAAGSRSHADGTSVSCPLLGMGLGTADRKYVYRLEEDIAWLLPTLAIVALVDAKQPGLGSEKGIVQSFYDEFGWVKNDAGAYNDTTDFTAIQTTAQKHADACNKRISAQLSGGEYLLDAASGPIPHPSYVALSEGYRFRICLDFSIRALREAKKRLPEGRGLFVLGDLTNLPIKDDVIDDVISLHTLYHVPPSSQSTAVDELVRVTKGGGNIVIVYTWNNSPLMSVVARVTMFCGRLKQTIRGKQKGTLKEAPSQTIGPGLYCRPLGREWFTTLKVRHSARLRLWSSTNAQFNAAFFKEGTFGRVMSCLVLRIEAFAEPLAARFGQYPMFVIRKRRSSPKAIS